MKCEICGAETTIHTTELQDDGRSVERHLCREHAVKAGLPVPTETQSAVALVPKLRSLVAFIRTNSRMPTRDEMAQFNAVGDLSEAEPGTPEFDQQVAYLEDFASFIETNGRYPTEQELPDPF